MGRGRPWRENLQKSRLECWGHGWGQIERRWFLVVLWEIDTKDFLPVQLFRALVRPDNLKVFFWPIFLSHDKRLLVKEKNTRTSREVHIERFFDPRDVRFVITEGHTHNLTTVTCLENPAEPGKYC